MFGKIFKQIYESSIARDYTVMDLFIHLIVLADAQGVVDMTYEAIARRTNRPRELVVSGIAELMQPDEESRSRTMDGARLIPIDSRRSWGWKIVNYEQYRNMRDEQSRKAYKRDWMRKHREKPDDEDPVDNTKSTKSTKVHKVHKGRIGADRGAKGRIGADGGQVWTGPKNPTSNEVQPNDLEKSTVDTRGHPWTAVDTRGPREKEKEIRVPSAVSLKRETPAQENCISDFAEAKRLICERILGGKDPNRPWSYQADHELARQLPIPLIEIERIAWFRGLAEDDKIPELKARRTITENGLTTFWSDEFSRANSYWQSLQGPPLKKEPAQWREFFKWKYDTTVNLPESFWDLDRDQREEYERDFQTFVGQEEVSAK